MVTTGARNVTAAPLGLIFNAGVKVKLLAPLGMVLEGAIV
jgi:hypothetical protein